ncbi:unnamed protein product [Tetraodon nigroviridis]|uniref:(spotted green pufferfish) hypothetical protein n=1 Tax=Tetraodon nigroviridis TaxID=99883 RepID=Q4SUB5_TETNG|nr:unnamed protein product [Tetraodon nigroviridis]
MFQVPSYSPLAQKQVPSSHLLDPPAAGGLTSPHGCSPPESLPHMAAELQANPPHWFHPVQPPSPHLLLPPVNPPHLNRAQMTFPVCPHPYVTSSLEPQPHLIPPPFAAQPQASPAELLSPPHQAYSQNPGSDWTRSSELSFHWRSDTFSYQNQNQLNSSLIPLQDQAACAHRLSCTSQTPPANAVYQQPDELCAVPDPCRSLEAALSQLQASTSAEDHLGRWGLMDFSSPTTEEAFSSQYYQHTAPQPFCSPTTPGPSPQYPQTPTLSSPPMQSWEETRNLYPQTSAQSSSPSLQEYEGYTSQHQVPPTNHLLMSQYELIQDQSGLFDAGLCPQVMAQEVGGSSPSPRLPAGLSWREDGGMAAGHGPSDVAWASEGTGTASDDPSLPPSVSMVMPVSVPVHSKGRAHKKGSGAFAASRKTALYQSLLREDASTGDGVGARHYTPPPMLCPVRAAPGLYCSLAGRRLRRVQTIQLHNTPDDCVAMETGSPPGTLRTGANQPQINVGPSFQAQIPLLQEKKRSQADSHKALQLWSAWEELDLPANQQRVEALLMMARSSVVPGGGASPESALHTLRQCRGDFVLTVEKLLSPPGTSSSSGGHQQYQQVRWSEAEKRLLVKSLQLYHKDFSRIQKAVRFHARLTLPSALGACSRVFVRSGPDQVRPGVRGVLLSVEEEDESQPQRPERQP